MSKLFSIPDSMEPLWDANSAKYKCCCRGVHVKSATLYIGYVQMIVTMAFMLVFAYYYVQVVNGHLPADHWITQYGEKYLSSLMFAVLIQLVIVTLMIHGVKTERRGLLLPFIILATIGIVLGFLQLFYDFVNLTRTPHEYRYSDFYENNQMFSHLIGTLIHAWCVSIVWRCYMFIGDKKMARLIGDQLRTTQTAFHFGDLPYGYLVASDPPPYADTVISDKQPLTSMA